MAARAYWKGFLRLSLVSVAVEVFNAEDRKSDIGFHQIHRATGKRVHYTKTVEGVGEIDSSDIASGFEIRKDVNVLLEPGEIDAVRLESRRTIELAQFVRVEEVDPRHFEQPYYVMPGDEYAAEGYLVIREALRKTGTMGLGQLTTAGREHLIGIMPLEQGLMLNRLRYADEVKPCSAFYGELPRMKLDHEMVVLATELIERKTGRFRPETFTDHYEAELRKLIARKAKGEDIVTVPEPKPPRGNVINLMDALRDSLNRGAGKAEACKPAERRKTAAKKPARKRGKAK
jgi:DNA end-binding protein Ku